jgi:peptidoglycan/LPS O-acetylase OafA/YrhL
MTQPDLVLPAPPGTAPGPLRAILDFLFPPLETPCNHIPSLDGIRAIAALMVVVSHCGINTFVGRTCGMFGVTLFFFLSGFLITTILRRELTKTGTVSLSGFYIKRCLRILPPCYIVILLALLAATITGERFSWPGTVSNFAYFTNYYMCHTGDGFRSQGVVPGCLMLWSLAVEEHFYLVFPLIFLLISATTRPRQGLILAALCTAVLLWRAVMVFRYQLTYGYIYFATDTRLDSILWGCLFAIVGNPVFGDRMAPKLARWPIVTVASIALALSIIIVHPWFKNIFSYTVQGLALMPLFTVAIVQGARRPFSLLNCYTLRLIGLYSYTIYLIHSLISYYLQYASPCAYGSGVVGFLITTVLVIVGSFLISAVMYQLVDKPTAELRKRYSSS